MKVKEIMKKEVITVGPETKLVEAIKVMFKSRVSGLPIVNVRGMLVGILSEKDAFRSLHPSYKEYYENPESFTDFEKMEREAIKRIKHLKVKQAMSREMITASLGTPILKVGALMLAKGIHRVPVIGKDRKLLGIVTRRDIYRGIFRKTFDL